MNIEQAIKLINSKKATIEDVYKFIFKDIEVFQKEREDFYIKEFKEQCEETLPDAQENFTERVAEKITANIERDTTLFVKEYVKQSIDALLDAYNSKRIKQKTSTMNFINLLTQLKETYEKT